MVFALKRGQSEFGAFAGIGAKLAFAAHDAVTDGWHVTVHAGFHLKERGLNPIVIAGIRDELSAKFDAVIEAIKVHPAIRVHEIARITYFEAVLA